jgi:Zn-dependent membrane protease YugP
MIIVERRLNMDPVYFIFALPALLLAMYAQWMVNHAYQQYLRVPNAAGVTGVEAAQKIIGDTGLRVKLEGIEGQLTDHYDPRGKVLRLSRGVATQPSIASVAIVAHEIGHAQQDAQGYLPLRMRAGLVPLVNLTSWLGPILFMVGLMLQWADLMTWGVWMFGGAVIFALITLPVELNASRRALGLLTESGILNEGSEIRGARKVLSAAALTYVAALAQSVSTLLYYLMMVSGLRRRQE